MLVPVLFATATEKFIVDLGNGFVSFSFKDIKNMSYDLEVEGALFVILEKAFKSQQPTMLDTSLNNEVSNFVRIVIADLET